MIYKSFTAAAVLILLLLSWCRLNDATSHLSSSSSAAAASSSVTEATASVASSASSFSVEESYVAQLVIVMSEGRSGSTELMDIINNIYDARCISGKELFNPLHNAYLKGHVTLDDPTGLINAFLLASYRADKSSIPYFKWKPKEFVFQWISEPPYKSVFEALARSKVKVVLNSRNYLDVFISMQRVLDITVEHPGVPTHNCFQGDLQCVQDRSEVKVTVDTSSILLDLNDLDYRHKMTHKILSNYNISFVATTYDKLNYGTNWSRLVELQRVVSYLRPGMRASMALFETNVISSSSRHQAELVENFKEMREVIMSSSYRHLLHA